MECKEEEGLVIVTSGFLIFIGCISVVSLLFVALVVEGAIIGSNNLVSLASIIMLLSLLFYHSLLYYLLGLVVWMNSNPLFYFV